MNRTQIHRGAARLMGALSLSIALAFAGCQTGASQVIGAASLPANLKTAGRNMDAVALGLERYGTISMSSPLLAPATSNDEQFKFTLKKGPDDYYKDAREQVQGKSAVLDQFSRVSGAGLSVQADLTQMLGFLNDLQAFRQDSQDFQTGRTLARQAAHRRAQAILATRPTDPTAIAEARDALADGLPTSRPDYPAAPAGEVPPPATNTAPKPTDALAVLSSDEFQAANALLAGTPELSLANRAAINIAAGDTASEAIFSLLANPGDYVKFQDKRLMYGVSMVSVNPGWLTQRNFAADITLTAEYVYEPARAEVLRHWAKVAADHKGEPGMAALSRYLNRAMGRGADSQPTSRGDPGMAAFLRYLSRAMGCGGSDEKSGGEGAPGADSQPPSRPAELPDTLFPRSGQTFLGVRPLSSGSGGLSRPQPGPPSNITAAPEVEPGFQVPDHAPSPLVAAVSPMTDAEVLDLSSSIRRQKAFAASAALALRFAGLGANAQVFDQWAKRLEKDTATRGASNAITAYSHSGGMFGFQIGPRLRALAEPAKNKSASADVLERQSFPVLIIVGLDADDLTPRFGYRQGVFTAFEPVLRFRQTMRWLPTRQDESGWLCKSPPRHGVSESQWLQWANGLQVAQHAIGEGDVEKSERLFRLTAAQHALQQLRSGKSIPAGDRTDRDPMDDGMIAALQWGEQALARRNSELAAALAGGAGGQNKDAMESEQRCLVAGLNALAGLNLKGRMNEKITADASRDGLCAAEAAVTDLLETARSQAASPQEFVDAARNRIQMLQYQAIGSWNYQSIPLQLITGESPTTAPAAAPEFTAILPSSATRGVATPMVIMGSGIEGAVSDASAARITAEGAGGTVTLVRRFGQAIAFTFTPDAAGPTASVAFRVPYEIKGPQGKKVKKSTLTPPILVVKPPSEPKPAPTTQAISRSRTDQPGTITETLQYPPEANPRIIEFFLQHPTTQPSTQRAGVNENGGKL